MPKRKHTKKKPVVVYGDANERIQKCQAERERVAEAMIKRREKLQKEYEEEYKRQKQEAELREMQEKKRLESLPVTTAETATVE